MYRPPGFGTRTAGNKIVAVGIFLQFGFFDIIGTGFGGIVVIRTSQFVACVAGKIEMPMQRSREQETSDVLAKSAMQYLEKATGALRELVERLLGFHPDERIDQRILDVMGRWTGTLALARPG